MSNKIKELRGQVRIALKEVLPEVLATELVANIAKALKEAQQTQLNTRLDTIEGECRKALEQADKRSRAVQGWIVQNARQEVSDQLFNMNVTLQAWEEVLADKIGNIADFNKLVDDRKKSVAAKLMSQAQDKMNQTLETASQEAPEVKE